MMGKEYELAIIGGGPGGLAAAARAKELGLKDVIIIEREYFLGGILPQCIHSGFGLEIFKEELTGPEYAQVFIDKIKKARTEAMLDTMALSIDKDRIITVTGKSCGIKKINAKSIILALGCREKTRGAINIPGSRPAGIFTAGLVQKMINIEGYLPGRKIVVLGSGDIGLIMARRLTLEGCRVEGVYELMPFSTGLKRNIYQCLDDYDIPLFLSHTVTNIYGKKRLQAVEISEVDRHLNIVKTKKKIECDTLLLSVGLIPENELSKTCGIEIDGYSGGPVVDENLMTSTEGIFSCGNSLYVNDLVDNVTRDGYVAAENAVSFIKEKAKTKAGIRVGAGNGIGYVVPHKVSGKSDVTFRIRPNIYCTEVNVIIENTHFKRKKKYITPGELVFLKVKSKDFKQYNLTEKKEIKFNLKKI